MLHLCSLRPLTSNFFYGLFCIAIVALAYGYTRGYVANAVFTISSLSFEKTIPVHAETLGSGKDENNRVYAVTSTEGRSFLVSADGELATSTQYTIAEIHRDEFWNPVSCSRVPFVQVGHTFYFLELKRVSENGIFSNKNYIYTLDTQNNTLTSYELGIQTVGYIYADKDSVYIVEPVVQNDQLLALHAYVFDENVPALTHGERFNMAPFKIFNPVYRRQNNSLVLSYTDNNLSTKNLAFTGDAFEHVDATTPEERVYFENDDFRVYEHLHRTYIWKQSIKDHSVIEIQDAENSEPLIKMDTIDGINKYVISDL